MQARCVYVVPAPALTDHPYDPSPVAVETNCLYPQCAPVMAGTAGVLVGLRSLLRGRSSHAIHTDRSSCHLVWDVRTKASWIYSPELWTERLLKKLLVLSSFLILAGIISINVSFGSVRQFLFDYHHDSLTSIHPNEYQMVPIPNPAIFKSSSPPLWLWHDCKLFFRLSHLTWPGGLN